MVADARRLRKKSKPAGSPPAGFHFTINGTARIQMSTPSGTNPRAQSNIMMVAIKTHVGAAGGGRT
jgi:hypothetical protein